MQTVLHTHTDSYPDWKIQPDFIHQIFILVTSSEKDHG